MISPELCVVSLSAPSSDAVIRALAGLLRARGHVRDSFEAAAIAREKRSPTGLPFPELAIALPHAEPEHVETPAIAIATLAAPVRFRQMGSPATQLDVRLVVMPALGSKEQAAGDLARLIELLQDEETTRALATAKSPEELCAALEARWREVA
jgi:PTS system galactitol-specific IIA component